MTDSISSTVLDKYRPGVEKDSPKKAMDELGQNEFMKLMLTQLKYQDPFKPMENGEFLAQMAQFSTVAGIEEMNSSMGSFVEEQTASQTFQAAGLLGKTVTTEGSSAILPESGSLQSQYQMPEASDKVSITFGNTSGEVVHKTEMNNVKAGIHSIEWDGYNDDGKRVNPGTYSIRVEYLNKDGGASIAETSISTTVEGVSFGVGSGKPTLSTSDGRELSISDIRKIIEK